MKMDARTIEVRLDEAEARIKVLERYARGDEMQLETVDKWNKVVKALENLYQRYNSDKATFDQELHALMSAYDNWLD